MSNPKTIWYRHAEGWITESDPGESGMYWTRYILVQQWIPTSEQPTEPGYYLVFRKENRFATTRRWSGKSWESRATITHWMPQPDPPE